MAGLGAFLALFLSVALLVMGNGLQSSLITIRAGLEGFPAPVIGLLTTAYFVGFVAGCFLAPRVVARVGHIRTFAAFASMAGAAALALALKPDPAFWIVLRVVTGVCFAGLYMVIESWISAQSHSANRGQVMATYRVVDLSASTVGQLLLAVSGPEAFTLFAVVTILIGLSVVPVSLTTVVVPQPVQAVRPRFVWLWTISPVAMVGCLLFGAANAAFWGMAPLYAQTLGYGAAGVASLMAATLVGGTIMQWPVGMLSDRMDRRYVLAVTGLVSTIVAVGLALFGSMLPFYTLMVAMGVYGGTSIPMYAVLIAHANDHMDAESFVEGAGTLLLAYALGATAGPLLAGGAMAVLGPAGLFVTLGLVFALLVAFIMVRLVARDSVPAEDKDDFVAVVRLSPALYAMDPRASEEEETDQAA